MQLGLFLGYQTAASSPAHHLSLTQEAERLGYAVAWAAEAYGSDSPSMLAWLAGQTSRIGLGSAVMQIPARTPATTAMTAATIDTLSGGRFRLGLGVSGPQVSEGWHGVRFAHPLARTREYVSVVRMGLARQRVQFDGAHYQLPLPDGPGKALKLGFHPLRSEVPIYLAAIGPRNLRLAGEVADGWLPIFFSPEHAAAQLSAVRAGQAAAGRQGVAFDVAPSVPVVVGDDVEACAELVRGYAALYVGGMGSREQNFYHQLAVRMGFGEAAERIQELYLAGKHREAAAAVPLAFLDQTALLGPVARIADRLQAYAEAGVTTLSVIPFAPAEGAAETLRAVAAAAERAAIGG
ncbi:LLM class F420-dependent oxidoreductase [Natronosporangium hydrolyticum]|uniref:LLM class F420-dependent oxidoreductase n=1 Tax=Natronosporangium hydrolyticum TaxID=2811111 RepID=A0A895Y5P6_9ACTN|nr:LLM class F420-dependent oxidoreductase [Natronosporangium hydrolyticum]QSB12721.1 LLM class F420-dependent oxidoreductase [Natronosporangium hydrolyticum]